MTEWPINSYPGDEVRLAVPTDVLTSYFYFQRIDLAAMRAWGLRIIGDSGAYSAMTSGSPVDREEFHRWAAYWSETLLWTASLDVIGEADATYRNWQAAQADGLALVPTIHHGESTATLDRYAEQGADLIGLGGMVPYASEFDRLLRWCLMMFRHARDHHPHVRFHGWGVSHPSLMDNLPWWSADSSGFSAAFRFARLRLFDPSKGRFVGVALNGRDVAAHHRLLADHYGLTDWRAVLVSTPATRRTLGRVAIKAMQLYSDWLSVRQEVSPPASLVPRLAAWAEAAAGPGGPVNAITPDGSGRSPTLLGPLQALALGKSNGSSVGCMSPDADTASPPLGPLSVSALGRDLRARVLGPQQAVALGSPEMQAVKALSPEDRSAPLTTQEFSS